MKRRDVLKGLVALSLPAALVAKCWDGTGVTIEPLGYTIALFDGNGKVLTTYWMGSDTVSNAKKRDWHGICGQWGGL